MKKLTEWHPFWISFPDIFEYNRLDMSVLDFIMNCYHKSEGGFGNYPTEKTPFVNSSAKGLICLNLFKKMNMIKKNDAFTFFLTCQNSDGGFGITNSQIDLYPSNLENTFYCVIALNLLGYLPRIKQKQQKIINWVLSHNNFDGGFHGDESVISNEYYTFLAIALLDILKNLDRIDSNLTIDFLISKQAKRNPEVTFTTSRLLSLHLLYGLERLNIKISISRLARCQNKNGGYRKKKLAIVYNSDIFSTHQSIIGLNIIGASNKIKKEKVIDWILSCQNEDGGFGARSNSNSSLSNTFAALISLYYLTRM